MRLGETRKTRDHFHWQHLLAWVGGILCATVPFIGYWEIGSMQIPVRHGPSHFGFNVLTVTGLCILGGVACGSWWRFCKWLLGERDSFLFWLSALLLGLGVSGWGLSLADRMQEHYKAWFVLLFSGILVLGLGIAIWARSDQRRELASFSRWLSERKRMNLVFFALLFLIFATSNVIFVVGMDVGWLMKTSVIIGRVFTSGVVAGVFCLMGELSMRASPKYFRWTSWLFISFVPLIIIVDQWMGVALGRRLIGFVNGLTGSGDFDPMVEITAGGLEMGPVAVILRVVGGILASLGSAWAGWVLSKRWKLRMSVGGILMITFFCWMGVVAEQGIGSKWKGKASWQLEHKVFDLHVGLFSPSPGLGEYRIKFFSSGDASYKPELADREEKPDIFIFMVESMRASAMREDTTPFMWRLSQEECQPFGTAWAGSNATHLAWFSFFHSQVPVYWRGTLEEIGKENYGSYKGAPPLRLLKQLGYEIQVRAVCDLDYKKFGLLSFGGGNTLAAVVEDSELRADFSGLNIPEREVKTFATLRGAVSERSQGGGLFFTAMDSPHYDYYWHDSFEPPFSDYEENIRFPFNPSEEEVQRYLRRYWNSCAWVDYQIKEFCDFLKQEGRYDDSIIIITGDHGEEFQEQGSWCHCSSLEPEQIQVPLLIKWPKAMGKGPARDIASHMDVMPTLLHALNAPKGQLPAMAGGNLLAEQKEASHTVVSTTAYAGKTGETMMLRNGAYMAMFSWPRYWEAQVPTEIVLERLEGAEGPIILSDPSAYLGALKEYFPDVFERFIQSIEAIEK